MIHPDLLPLARPISDFVLDPRNARRHPEKNLDAIKASLTRFGQRKPIVVRREGMVVEAGNGTLEAAIALGWTSLAAVLVDDDPATATGYALADNRTAELATWDDQTLGALLGELRAEGFDLTVTGWATADLADMERAWGAGAGDPPAPPPAALADEFGAPPFTVFDAKQGYWQARKKEWIAAGVGYADGRGENLTMGPGLGVDDTPWAGTSIFDPVLCELLVSWFSPPGGTVLDPFAGGAVRGLVSSALGRAYVGVELRADQVAENERALGAFTLPTPGAISWIVGDSAAILPRVARPAQMILGCPPYYDLEKYSDDPQDLSNMPWGEFLSAYRAIVAAACAKLEDDSFACWVVGEVRDPSGGLRGLVYESVAAFEDAGLAFYGDAVLLTAIATAAIRARGQFLPSRKLVKTHQNVLVFVKGDARRAAEKCGAPARADLAAE